MATENIHDFESPGSLQAATYQLLKKDGRSLSDISTSTGISFYWLQRFSQNVFKNPSVNRVQYLYEELSGKKLVV